MLGSEPKVWAAAGLLCRLTLSFIETVDDELFDVLRQHIHLAMAAATSYRRLHGDPRRSEVSRGGH